MKYRITTSAAAFETAEAHTLAKSHPGRQQVHRKLNNPSRLTLSLCACPYLKSVDFPSPDSRSSISSNSTGETFGAKLRDLLPLSLPLPAKHSREHEDPQAPPHSLTDRMRPPPRTSQTQTDHRSGRHRARIGPIPHPHPHPAT